MIKIMNGSQGNAACFGYDTGTGVRNLGATRNQMVEYYQSLVANCVMKVPIYLKKSPDVLTVQ